MGGTGPFSSGLSRPAREGRPGATLCSSQAARRPEDLVSGRLGSCVLRHPTAKRTGAPLPLLRPLPARRSLWLSSEVPVRKPSLTAARPPSSLPELLRQACVPKLQSDWSPSMGAVDRVSGSSPLAHWGCHSQCLSVTVAGDGASGKSLMSNKFQ